MTGIAPDAEWSSNTCLDENNPVSKNSAKAARLCSRWAWTSPNCGEQAVLGGNGRGGFFQRSPPDEIVRRIFRRNAIERCRHFLKRLT